MVSRQTRLNRSSIPQEQLILDFSGNGTIFCGSSVRTFPNPRENVEEQFQNWTNPSPPPYLFLRELVHMDLLDER
jgi:hypothetical protein